MQPQLILFEGISGAGKSYSSQLLSFYFKRQGLSTHWLYENTLKSPIYAAEQVLALSSRKECDLLHDTALKNWQHCVKETQRSGRITIVDAHYLQILITTLLAFGFDDEAIWQRIEKVNQVIATLNPYFIYYHQKEVKRSLKKMLSSRGEAFASFLSEKIKQSAYTTEKPLTDEDLVYHFFSHYQKILNHTFSVSCFKKLKLSDPFKHWSNSLLRIQDFLSINDITPPHCPENLVSAVIGSYQLENSEMTWQIIAKESRLSLQTPLNLHLFYQSKTSFQVEGMEAHIEFLFDTNANVTTLRYYPAGDDDLTFLKIDIGIVHQ